MLNRLKKIEQILKEVSVYFANNPVKEEDDYFNQSIKFLKNYNLLALQLGDLSFRKTIMMQVLFFTHALMHPLVKYPINLSETEKKIVIDIENIARKFLSTCGEEGKHLLE